ncbi:MAG TPA: carbohydrate ABC transporter permease [Bacillaceae bacterium]
MPIKRLFLHAALAALSVAMFFPFLWMAISAIKTKEEVFRFPPTLWPENAQWHNFLEAWNAAPFSIYIFNSIYTAVAIVFLQVFCGALLAYAFTQFQWRGQNLLFGVVMATYMLPGAATYVPSYVILSKLNLIDSHGGLILSNMVSVFGIFLLRQAFLQVPKEMIDAARVDGAGEWKILWRILFPLTKPTFIIFALISFVQNYNNYLWPSLIIKSEKLYLITIGLRQFFIQDGAYGIQWPLVMAASTFTVLPLLILFFLAQRFFVRGITDGGLKG